MVVILFFKDGSHELIESTGISFLTKVLRKEKVVRIYFAKSNADAKAAIQVLTPEKV